MSSVTLKVTRFINFDSP